MCAGVFSQSHAFSQTAVPLLLGRGVLGSRQKMHVFTCPLASKPLVTGTRGTVPVGAVMLQGGAEEKVGQVRATANADTNPTYGDTGGAMLLMVRTYVLYLHTILKSVRKDSYNHHTC